MRIIILSLAIFYSFLSSANETKECDYLFSSNPTNRAENLSFYQELTDCFERESDYRLVFVKVYELVTQGLYHEIDRGYFEDPTWIKNMINSFTRSYIFAVYHYSKNNFSLVPFPWYESFSNSKESLGPSALGLMYAVNAHINYDLPHSLYETHAYDLKKRKRDYFKLNDFFKNNMTLIHQYVEEMDHILGTDLRVIFDFRSQILFPLKKVGMYQLTKAYRRNAWIQGKLLDMSDGSEMAEKSLRLVVKQNIKAIHKIKRYLLKEKMAY